MRKIFSDKKSLRSWAIGAVGVIITSISVVDAAKNMKLIFSHPQQLVSVMDFQPEFIPEGKYIVEYSNSNELCQNNIDYSKMVMVISMEAKLANDPVLIGGLRPLLEALGDFEYCCSIDRTNPPITVAGIWVLEPQDPVELERLDEILGKHSIMYVFNDGSGYVNLNNSRMGRGIHSTVMI